MAYERKTIDIHISDDLRNILNEIESESIVASLLLKKRHSKEDLVEDPVNYISISSQDRTRLSYLTIDRIKSIDIDGDYWKSSRRYNAKPGSFISKIFKDIPAKEVEKFSNLYKSEVNKPAFTFKVVKGEEIREYYSWKKYCDNGRGTLGASCMKHDGCQRSMDVYAENPEASMLIMLNSDEMLMGRALLWDFDSHKIMDRIYTISDEELQFYFKKWATKNGYFYKSEQNWYNTLYFEQFGGKKIELYLDLKINTDFRHLPYMDTFKFIDTNTGVLYNYIPKGTSVRTLCATDGSRYDGDYLRFDSIDKVFRYRGEAVYIDYLDIFTTERNTCWSNINDKYILKKDSIYNEDLNDYLFNEENDHLNNKERIDDLKKRIEEDRKRREERANNRNQAAVPGLSMREYFDIMQYELRNRQAEVEPVNEIQPDEIDLEQPITTAVQGNYNMDDFSNYVRETVYRRFGVPRGYFTDPAIQNEVQNEPVVENTTTNETQNEESDV
jgi:hypothetical protein